MNKSGYDMSSEEIADEIQSEGIKENIPYYASMIEEYADKLMDAQIQDLKKIENSVRNCFLLVERALESYKKEGITENDWLEGQLHAFNKCLRILTEKNTNKE